MGLVVVYHIQSYQLQEEFLFGSRMVNYQGDVTKSQEKAGLVVFRKDYPVALVVPNPQLCHMEEGKYYFCCCSYCS